MFARAAFVVTQDGLPEVGEAKEVDLALALDDEDERVLRRGGLEVEGHLVNVGLLREAADRDVRRGGDELDFHVVRLVGGGRQRDGAERDVVPVEGLDLALAVCGDDLDCG